jgi:hypothetical protein
MLHNRLLASLPQEELDALYVRSAHLSLPQGKAVIVPDNLIKETL